MIQVQFYHLRTNASEDILNFTTRLVASVFEAKQKVHVWLPNESLVQTLSTALWNAPGRFLAHHCFKKSASGISLGIAGEPTFESEVLINLSNLLPPLDLTFLRIVELVWESSEQKAEARKRYSLYLKQNIQPQYLRVD